LDVGEGSKMRIGKKNCKMSFIICTHCKVDTIKRHEMAGNAACMKGTRNA